MNKLFFILKVKIYAWQSSRVDEGERGDVPGWVLVTLMTAGLVTVLWAVAGDALVNLFQEAISSVKAPGN